ncbi:hypothetical protein RhiirA5_398930 [Rhizophagus irregularis]|uniref:Uncharacterized protein n=1 Tax=Rhizophagus irregularis TaxID=588596 RepID=A0A2I1EPX6_9GLOM|nr:hypothetical protein RhiirA5_402931 [Rhizophagus irregularis]PKC09082.1 hypothetical protein RhiirA5_398930 [Rhizophagus irregularis]PKY24176.1 hypothetical protein RhiirB3_471856 [Rhizophagus irregularis]
MTLLVNRCEEIAEIEKIKGLKKGDKEKRKERKEGIDDKGGEKKKKKLEKTLMVHQRDIVNNLRLMINGKIRFPYTLVVFGVILNRIGNSRAYRCSTTRMLC